MTGAGISALVALAFTVCALGYAHVKGAYLSPVSAAVSQYGISPEPLRLCYRLATLGLAVGAIALRLGIGGALTAPGKSAMLLGLVIFAAGRAFIGWIPMDAPGSPATMTGRIHWLLGIISFASAIYAANTLASVLSHQDRWHSLADSSSILGWIMLVGVAPLLLSRLIPPLRKIFGAAERLFYAGAIVWLALFAAACAASAR